MDEKQIIKNKLIARIIFGILSVTICLLLAISVFDTNKTVSEKENRALEPMPKFSISSLFSGEFIEKFETHYTDTFPFRDFFMDVNAGISKVFKQTSAGEDDIVIISANKTEDDFAGESLDDVQ